MSEVKTDGFRGVPGVPDGWELVGVRPVEPGEYRMVSSGEARLWNGDETSLGWAAVIRKTEKPKRFRTFKNAEEFKPHRDRWVTVHGEEGFALRINGYDDDGAWYGGGEFVTYGNAAGITFEDGTPFGVEVTDE